MKTLVLGLGNELYGDDGVGIQVIEQLKQDVSFLELLGNGQSIHLEASPLTGLSLLDIIVGFNRLIIIDTIKVDHPVTGKITVIDGKNLRHIPGPSPHYISIPQMLEIGRKNNLTVPDEVKVIAVEAKNIYMLGEGLSPEMKKAIPHIIDTLYSILKEGKN